MQPTTSARSSSQARARALSILHPVYPREAELFAHYMWPLSPSWRRPNPGRAIQRKAASFLAGLSREGLVEVRSGDSGPPGYVLTSDGVSATAAPR